MTDRSTPTLPSAGAAAGAAGLVHYRLLPERTAVTFTTRHLLGLGRVAGSVRLRAGRMAVDPDGWRLAPSGGFTDADGPVAW